MSKLQETVERLVYSTSKFNPETERAAYLRDLVERAVREGIKMSERDTA